MRLIEYASDSVFIQVRIIGIYQLTVSPLHYRIFATHGGARIPESSAGLTGKFTLGIYHRRTRSHGTYFRTDFLPSVRYSHNENIGSRI